MARSWTEKQKKEAAKRMRKSWAERKRLATKSTKVTKTKARPTGKPRQLKPGVYMVGNVLLTLLAK